MPIVAHNKFPFSSLPQTGIDALLNDSSRIEYLKNKKIGMLANQASVTSDFIQSAYALQQLLGPSLFCLFAPEHGWSAFCAAGEEIENVQELHTNLPVFSLFGPQFEKNLNILQDIDVLIIDIQDAGVRCYTYAATCAKMLEHASLKKYSLEFIICDRPNPLGNHVNGPGMSTGYQSLISHIDVPFQHGKTMGKLLEKHNLSLPYPLPFSIIACSPVFHPKTHLWVPSSPGLPDWDAVLLYPGLVLLEGANISEGRGSTLPFKCVAAPDLEYMKVVEQLNEIPDSGIKARPFSFIPQSGKFLGKTCQGAQIHIIDYQKVDGLRLGIYLLHILIQNYPLFEWENSQGRYFIDNLTGSPDLRKSLGEKQSPQDILVSWKGSLERLSVGLR